MDELLRPAADIVSLGLNALALLVIAVGAINALIGLLKVMWPGRHATGTEKRGVWLEFSRWLIAGLTFQLAADIVQTMVVPGWQDVGRVAAVAVIRAFLTYTIDRDIDSLRERDAERRERDAGHP